MKHLQPQIFTYSHVGPRWTFEWITFAQEVPRFFDQGFSNAYLPARVWVHLRGGGEETFTGPDNAALEPGRGV